MTEPRLPERIKRLDELANNLWWSWHQPARELFRALDYPLWRTSGHNPVKQLRDIGEGKLEAAAADPTFLSLYDAVIASLDAAILGQETWFSRAYPGLAGELIAFFSAEFAIHNSLPIYAGGLGALAGDICKEASDIGVPMVGVGFMYPQGYFRQRISDEGWQEESYRQLNFDEAPVNPVLSPQGQALLTGIELGNRSVFVRVWQVRLGRVSIYLLDTNVEENPPLDRQLSARLYTADREQRLQQEIILGIGGVRVLRALGIRPTLWHANEGHTAFMMLERVKEEVELGSTFAEAVRKIQASSIFTTHTPVPAGHDIFPLSLMEKFFRDYSRTLGIDFGAFLRLGQQYGDGDQNFNMTVLSLRLSDHRNAVSKLHETVTRRMWHGLWPEATVDDVPITHVTNGIHVLSWLAPEMSKVYEKHLGQDISKRYDDTGLYEKVLQIPDEEIWRVRETLRSKLVGAMLEKVQKCWAEGDCPAEQIVALGALFSPEVLTIGFVRRFTEYKRPGLIFQDIERLKRLVTDPWHPVQIVFAGKSHPADFASKFLLHNVYMMATAREFHGRIAFVEDYDMHMARYLVQGVDVWLNTPRRLQEACGTSGMKAAANGGLHLSVRDGWWHEACNGKNGWAIGDGPEDFNPADEDRTDAESLYQLLEQQIVPLFYDRDRSGVPHGWVRMVKESIGSIVPFFSSRRMLKEYVTRMYLPAWHSMTR